MVVLYNRVFTREDCGYGLECRPKVNKKSFG